MFPLFKMARFLLHFPTQLARELSVRPLHHPSIFSYSSSSSSSSALPPACRHGFDRPARMRREWAKEQGRQRQRLRSNSTKTIAKAAPPPPPQ